MSLFTETLNPLSNNEDRETLVKLLSSDFEVECDAASRKWIEGSYSYISSLESPKGMYIPGSPQALTWTLLTLRSEEERRKYMPLADARSKLRIDGSTSLSIDRGLAQDYAALAPLNLTPSRILTYVHMPLSSRASLRYNMIVRASKVDCDIIDPIDHRTVRVQVASVAALPAPVLTREAHERYWRRWDGQAFTPNGQKVWEPLRLRMVVKGLLTTSTYDVNL